MEEFFNTWVSKLLETFKQKNPKLYAILFVVLLVGIYFAQQGSAFGIFAVSPLIAKIIGWASTLFGFLMSTQLPGIAPKREPG